MAQTLPLFLGKKKKILPSQPKISSIDFAFMVSYANSNCFSANFSSIPFSLLTHQYVTTYNNNEIVVCVCQ